MSEFELIKTLKPPTGMSFHEGNIAENWKRFKQKMTFYLDSVAAEHKSDRMKIGLLMTTLGDHGLDIFNSFKLAAEPAYGDVIAEFDKYCGRNKNLVLERYVFFSMIQHQNQTTNAFVTELRVQAAKCGFVQQEVSNLIRDRLISGMADSQLRLELLQDPELTLEKAVSLCRVTEKSNMCVKIESEAVKLTGKAHDVRVVIQKFDGCDKRSRLMRNRKQMKKPARYADQ